MKLFLCILLVVLTGVPIVVGLKFDPLLAAFGTCIPAFVAIFIHIDTKERKDKK